MNIFFLILIIVVGIFVWLVFVVFKLFVVWICLLDNFDYCKVYVGVVLLVGGFSVFFGLFVVWVLVMLMDLGYVVFFFCLCMLVVIGVVDDVCDLFVMFCLLV